MPFLEWLVQLHWSISHQEPTNSIPSVVLHYRVHVVILEPLFVHLQNFVSGSAHTLVLIVVEHRFKLVCIGIPLILFCWALKSIEKVVRFLRPNISTEFTVLALLFTFDYNISGIGHFLLVLVLFDFVVELHHKRRIFQPLSYFLFGVVPDSFLVGGLPRWISEIWTFGFFVVPRIGCLPVWNFH